MKSFSKKQNTYLRAMTRTLLLSVTFLTIVFFQTGVVHAAPFASFEKYYRTNDNPNKNGYANRPSCPPGWTVIDEWAVDEGDHADGFGDWHGGVSCSSTAYTAASSKYYRDRSPTGNNAWGNLNCPAGWTQLEEWVINEGDSADGGGGNHRGKACILNSGGNVAVFSKYYRTKDNPTNGYANRPSCPPGWTVIDEWAVDEGDHADGHGDWHGGVSCSSTAYTAASSKYWRQETPSNSWGNFGCPSGWTRVDAWLGVSEGDPADGGGGLHDGIACALPITTGTIVRKVKIDGVEKTVSFLENYTPPGGSPTVATMNLPATFTNMLPGTWSINTVTLSDSSLHFAGITGCGNTLPCSATLAPGSTLTLTYNFAKIVAPTGTVIEKATLDGKSWDSPPFAVSYDAPFGTNNIATIDPEQTIPGMPAGTYVLKGVTAPPGVTLKDVNGSSLPYNFNLAPNGTITLVYNFVTPPPVIGTLQIRATKDGQPWDSPAFPVNMSLPGGSVGDISVNPPQDTADSPLGAYRINGVTSPSGVTFQNVNGSSLPYSRALGAGETLILTFNFTTIVAATPTLIVTPSFASAGINGAQQFNAIYDPDGSGPQASQAVTNSSLWSSSNDSVAVVNSLGSATGKNVGSATITASYSGLTASASLAVLAPTPTLRITPSSASIALDKSYQFTAAYDPDGSGPQPSQDVTASATWTPTDASRVTVVGGLATRVGHGETTIRVSHAGLDRSATVLDPAQIRVIPASASLQFGETVQLTACLNPGGAVSADCSGASERFVTDSSAWSSSRLTRAQVNNTSQKGLVTAQSQSGTATIRASYGWFTPGSANIQVIAPPDPALLVSCSASPTETTTDKSVIWTAVVSGGTGSYSYSWSGSSPLNGKTGNPVMLVNGYSASGTKTGSVSVTSGSQTVTQSCSNSVTVSPPSPPPTATLSADPESIDKGQSSTLTWSSTNADSCAAIGGFDTGGATSGSISVSPTATSNYQISCAGPGGSANSNVATVTVISVTASIGASPSCVQGGGSAKISWSAAPATQVASCTVSGPGLSSSSLSGSQTVNVTSKSTYTIACQTTSGSAVTKQVIVDTSGCYAEF